LHARATARNASAAASTAGHGCVCRGVVPRVSRRLHGEVAARRCRIGLRSSQPPTPSRARRPRRAFGLRNGLPPPLDEISHLHAGTPIRSSAPRATSGNSTVASLTSVIFPSGLMVTRASRLASMRLRAYWDAARACSSARTRSVMSRAIDAIPSTLPSLVTAERSFIGGCFRVKHLDQSIGAGGTAFICADARWQGPRRARSSYPHPAASRWRLSQRVPPRGRPRAPARCFHDAGRRRASCLKNRLTNSLLSISSSV
jgi:hypothetical protein